jgi:hypothetical protein
LLAQRIKQIPCDDYLLSSTLRESSLDERVGAVVERGSHLSAEPLWSQQLAFAEELAIEPGGANRSGLLGK